MVKVTFTLDDETVAALRRTAARLRRPRSQVVREALRDYAARLDRLGGEEQRRLLAAIDALRARPATRSGRAVDAELAALRRERRSWGPSGRGSS